MCFCLGWTSERIRQINERGGASTSARPPSPPGLFPECWLHQIAASHPLWPPWLHVLTCVSRQRSQTLLSEKVRPGSFISPDQTSLFNPPCFWFQLSSFLFFFYTISFILKKRELIRNVFSTFLDFWAINSRFQPAALNQVGAGNTVTPGWCLLTPPGGGLQTCVLQLSQLWNVLCSSGLFTAKSLDLCNVLV